MVIKFFTGIVLLLSSVTVMAQSLVVAENGESENTTNWQVFDANPAGFEIKNASEAQNHYISFTSDGRLNGFMLGNTSTAAPGLNLVNASLASFRMRATAGFTIEFVADTDNGIRYIRYSHSRNTNPVGASRVVSIGLGTDSYNGYWQSYSRNLQADLSAAQPGNNILAINGIQVRGSIDLDDVFFFAPDEGNTAPVAAFGGDQEAALGQSFELNGSPSSDAEAPVQLWRWTDDKNNLLGNTESLTLPAQQVGRSAVTLTVTDASGASNSASVDLTVLPPEGLHRIVENAEQGDTSNWRVADSTPAGPAIDNTEEDGNRFIALTSTDQLNAFIIGNRTATAAGLGLESRPRVSWRLRAASAYTLLFALDTSNGFRYLVYTSSRLSQPSGSGSSVRMGLGSLSTDGNWHLFNRDLQADLQQAQPGNSIISINGLVIRGSLDIDDLIFYGDETGTPTPPVVPEVPPQRPNKPVNVSPEVNVDVNEGAMVEFVWQFDPAVTGYDFHVFNRNSSQAVDFVYDLLPDDVCESDSCSYITPVTLPVGDNHAWRVRAGNGSGKSDWSTSFFNVVEVVSDSPPTGEATERPPTPVNVSPSPATEIAQHTDVEFVWEQDSAALTYEFHIFDNVAKTTTPYVVGLEASDICSEGLCRLTQTVTQPVATYHAWRVRGRNSLGPSSWSRSIFTVIESTVDPKPENAAPEASFVFAGFR